MHPAEKFFRRRFRQRGDAERARGEKAYLKSSLRFHGVMAAEVRAAAADYLRERPELDRKALIETVDALFESDFHDLRSAGIALLERRGRLLSAEDAEWLIELVRRSPGWAHVDWIAAKILGELVAREPKLGKRILGWAKDENFWVRRSALLAELHELRHGRGNFERFARIAAPMLEEREFFIRKAIGWVLREVSKRRPELTRDFLVAHGYRASGLTLREGSKYLPAAMQREVTRAIAKQKALSG